METFKRWCNTASSLFCNTNLIDLVQEVVNIISSMISSSHWALEGNQIILFLTTYLKWRKASIKRGTEVFKDKKFVRHKMEHGVQSYSASFPTKNCTTQQIICQLLGIHLQKILMSNNTWMTVHPLKLAHSRSHQFFWVSDFLCAQLTRYVFVSPKLLT